MDFLLTALILLSPFIVAGTRVRRGARHGRR